MLVLRQIELRRHTDADGDVLTAAGVAEALAIGARLRGQVVVRCDPERRRQFVHLAAAYEESVLAQTNDLRNPARPVADVRHAVGPGLKQHHSK